MGTRIDRVDAYIAKSADFARPILEHLREVVHEACPEAEEAIKWSSPHFLHRGMLCGMAGFKEHCRFILWNGTPAGGADSGESVRALGPSERIARLSDLPPEETLIGYIREAARRNEAGVKRPGPSKPRTPRELVVPDDLVAALGRDAAARSTFDGFSPSNKREYVEWLAEAKTQATRSKRLGTALEWMAEGKPRNWKYMNC